MDIRFADRIDAGRQLAAQLERFKDFTPLILALPRGGVPVAHPIAEALGAQLDILMVRKIGVPWHPEFALAAVMDGDHPQIVVNDDVAEQMPLPPGYLQQEAQRQLREIETRRIRYLGDRRSIPTEGRVVIVVDDGIATGATIRAALKGLRRHKPARLVVATPVAPADTVERLRAEADEVVCLSVPKDFRAVGLHYRNFDQVEDDEVIRILAHHQGRGRPKSPVSEDEAVIEEVRRRMLSDHRIDLAHHPIAMTYANGLLIMQGEVPHLAAKRLAVALARKVPKIRDVEDRLFVAPARRLRDPEVRDAVETAFHSHPYFRRYSLYVCDQGRIPIREQPGAEGEVEIAIVEKGVVTLRGRVKDVLARQMAGVVAWHAEGVRGVVNEVAADDASSRERQLDQAVRLALDADPEIKTTGVTATTLDRTVILDGRVRTEDDCVRAESDVWMVDGVGEVVNRIAIG